MGQFDLQASASHVTPTTSISARSRRAISTDLQRNPWGRSNDDGGLNPHRTDLWYVDFSSAIKNLQAVAADVQSVPAYYVLSTTLPGYVIRAETYRRGSIPFQMPSWDEPVEPLTLTFLMESVNPNRVIDFLTTWQAQTRAGRGERFTNGFAGGQAFTQDGETIINPNFGQVTLNDNYTIDFVYTFTVWLLQGATAPAQVEVQDTDTFQEQLALQRRQREAQDIWKTSNTAAQRNAVTTRADFSAATSAARQKLAQTPAWCQCERIFPIEVRAWLASFKIGDLTYKGTDLLTIEARFYPEYIEQQS